MKPILFSSSAIVLLSILGHGIIKAYGRRFTVGQGVVTSSGLVLGHPASQKTQVSEYLGIPFAKPPIGSLRFTAPQAFEGSGEINASVFAPDCPANVATTSVADGGGLTLAGPAAVKIIDNIRQFGKKLGEDCLTLNIWTKPQDGENAKAVLFWIYGGGFSTGTTNSFLYNGQFLADNEDVIVVSANYRVSVFGFPGLPGMNQNLGLLDQRLAIEWVKMNIAGFGGDPTRITLFGQSAGGSSVDYYSYAWTADPIVHGFISESGVATSFAQPTPADNLAAWNTLTQNLSCGTTTSSGVAGTVACMQMKSMEEILHFSGTAGAFGPTIDNKLIFANYTRQTKLGKFIKLPMLLGNNDYEAGIIKVLYAKVGKVLPLTQWAILNLENFTCPVGRTAELRASFNIPTWRYRYFGDFENLKLTLDPDSGAWHGSEIAIVFGTAAGSGAEDSPAENATSRYMMRAWAMFAKDPAMALSRPPFHWPQYDPQRDTLIRLGYNNEQGAQFIPPNTYDQACSAILTPSGPGMDALSHYPNLLQLGGGSQVNYR